MARAVPLLPPEQLSELIGAIYDCAIDPGLWPETINAICAATDCCSGLIAVTDLDPPQVRLMKSWNYDTDWLARVPDYAEEIATEVWAKVPNLDQRPLDEPGSPRRELPPGLYENTRWAREMIDPFGIVDSIHLLLMREPARVAEFALSRHETVGMATEREFSIMRLLAPHIRRSVTISDLIDMKRLETQALGAALDSVATGVVVVGDNASILHANESARQMLNAGTPIAAFGGRLSALKPDVTQELMKAIHLAQSDESTIGAAGIGVPLVDKNMSAATATVLPLAGGTHRTRLVPRATAAVFVASAGEPAPADIGTVARVFGLTPTETRLLEHLVTGDSLSRIALTLGVTVATAKTHRRHIFAKMGVARRTDLLALVGRLVPAVRRPATASRL